MDGVLVGVVDLPGARPSPVDVSGRAWSGGLWWVVGRGEQGLPVLLLGPVRRQVQQDAPGSVGDAGRDVDQLPAGGGCTGGAVAGADQAAGGTQQVVG